MDLERWDNEVKPHLEGIRLDAGWIGFYASSIGRKLRKLPFKPDFPTEAESKLTEAVQELEMALLGLREARDVFRSMQTEKH